MTLSEVMALQAGPELNLLLAEKVRGWVRVAEMPPEDSLAGLTILADNAKYEAAGFPPRPLSHWFLIEGNIRKVAIEQSSLPDVSGDIAAAWELVEALHAKGLDIEIRPLDDGWKATVYRWRATPLYFAGADTAPLAICRAALMTVEDKP